MTWMIDDEDTTGGTVTDFSGDDGTSFEGFDDSLDLSDMDAGAAPIGDAEPAVTPQPASAGQDTRGAPPSTPTPGQPTTPGTTPAPAAVPGTTPAAPQATGPQGAPQPAPTPEPTVDFETYVAQNSETFIKQLSEGPLKLTDEEVKAFGDAAPTVTKYLARTFLYMMASQAQAIRNSLPQSVGNLIQVYNSAKQQEEGFFGAYPQLKTVNREQLGQLSKTLRQSHQTMPAEEFYVLLARTAAAYFQVPLAPVRGQPRPHTPASQGQRGGTSPHPAQRRVVQNDPGDWLGGINSNLMNGGDEF